jgi:hypothetical protein
METASANRLTLDHHDIFPFGASAQRALYGEFPPFYAIIVVGAIKEVTPCWGDDTLNTFLLDSSAAGTVLYAHVENGRYRAVAERVSPQFVVEFFPDVDAFMNCQPSDSRATSSFEDAIGWLDNWTLRQGEWVAIVDTFNDGKLIGVRTPGTMAHISEEGVVGVSQ